MPSGQGLSIFIIAMNCIFLAMAKAMELTPDQEGTPEMLDQETIDEIVNGAVDAEVFTTTIVVDSDERYQLEDLDYWKKLPYMRETWKKYLKEWLEGNEELIKLALKEYNYYEYGAYGLGIDVGHSILDTDVSFDNRDFLDANLADALDDSLSWHWRPNGMHEIWLENSELHISRWGLD